MDTQTLAAKIRKRIENGASDSDLVQILQNIVAAERERCAAWCDNRANYYGEGDDDGFGGLRNRACEACADAIRWPANWDKNPQLDA
jgi:hypothetical protein